MLYPSSHSSRRLPSKHAHLHTPLLLKMAALIAPVAVVAPRVVAPKARATRTLRATAFKGARVSATPKVRDGRKK